MSFPGILADLCQNFGLTGTPLREECAHPSADHCFVLAGVRLAEFVPVAAEELPGDPNAIFID